MRTTSPIVSKSGQEFAASVVMLAYCGFFAVVGGLFYAVGGLPALCGMIVIPTIGAMFRVARRATKHPRE